MKASGTLRSTSKCDGLNRTISTCLNILFQFMREKRGKDRMKQKNPYKLEICLISKHSTLKVFLILNQKQLESRVTINQRKNIRKN